MNALAAIAQQMNQELAGGSSMEIGKTLQHPDGRTVKVTSGCFLDPVYGRVSNYWHWNEILPNGSIGPDEHGYGW